MNLWQIHSLWVERRAKHPYGRFGYPTNKRSRGGCLRRPFEWLYNRLTYHAAKRGVPCSLTFEQFFKFTQIVECHYCGVQVQWTPRNGLKHKNWSINLDRKNNLKGYENNNVVVACVVCNRIKNNYFSYGDMMVLSPGLRQIQVQRKAGTV